MPGEIVMIKKRAEFINYLNVNKYVIVKIGALWCGPCKRSTPEVERLFKHMPENVNMVLVDADTCSDVKSYLKIKVIPTLIIFVNAEQMEIYQTSNVNEIQTFFKRVLELVSTN